MPVLLQRFHRTSADFIQRDGEFVDLSADTRDRKCSVNVLAETQQAISDQFGRKGRDRWEGIVWRMTSGQNPVIAGTLMWLDCKIVAEHQAGDHYIVIGEVVAISPNDWHDGAPLLYFKGRYRCLHDASESAGS